MKTTIILFITMSLCVFHATAQQKRSSYEKKTSPTPVSDVHMLPEDFKVYVKGNQVVNQPYAGFEQKTLPVKNHYKGADGGYVAVYSKKQQGSVYSVGGGIYVIGMVRVKGAYIGTIFYPEGYKQGDNITQDANILAICNNYFPAHKGQLWIGGDTGGFYQNSAGQKKEETTPKKRKAFE